MSKPHNILFVHYGDDGIRGSERVLIDLIENLPATITAHLWTNNPSLLRAIEPYCLTTTLDRFSLIFGWTSPRFDLINHFRLKVKAQHLIEKNQIDLIHCNSGGPNQWLNSVAKRLNTPILLHLHAHYLMRDLISLGIFTSPLTVAASPSVTSDLRKMGISENNTRTITNRINDDQFFASKALDIRESNHIAKDAFLIACVGALIPMKGPQYLIEALGILLQNGLKPHVVFIGEGESHSSLKSLAEKQHVSEQITFLGQRQDVASILRGSIDCFVMPSLGECYPLVLVEAAFARLPTIGTNTGGIPHIIQHESTGLIVPTADATSLAKGISRLMHDPIFAEQLGDGFYEESQERFQLKSFTEEFHSLYQMIFDNPSLAIPKKEDQWIALKIVLRFLKKKIEHRFFKQPINMVEN
jgi:glycosyltransferase involved in cell wall biosynthesis